MARIRTIKPGFFRSEDVSALPMRARLTWVGLWTHCDDEGRAKDNVKLIKADVWPLDQVSLREIEEDLETLAAHGRIVRYEVDGRRYLAVTNWREHQSINKPTPSKIPPPPTKGSGPTPVALPESNGSPTGRRGREGKGGEGTRAHARDSPQAATLSTGPPRRCEQHLNDTNPPNCGPCKDARIAAEKWETGQAELEAAARQARAEAERNGWRCRCGVRNPVGTAECRQCNESRRAA